MPWRSLGRKRGFFQDTCSAGGAEVVFTVSVFTGIIPASVWRCKQCLTHTHTHTHTHTEGNHSHSINN